jgi:hypothetical protein
LSGVATRIERDLRVRALDELGSRRDCGETTEYQAHRDEVTPLAGWL